MKKLPLKMKIFFISIYVITLIAFIVSILTNFLPTKLCQNFFDDIAFFGIFALLTETFVVSFKNMAFSTTFAVTIASFTLFGPLMTIIIIVFGHLFRVLKVNSGYKHLLNTPVYGTCYNCCTLVLSVISGNAVFRLTGGSGIQYHSIMNTPYMDVRVNLLNIVFFSCAFFFTNTFIMSILYALNFGKKVVYSFISNIKLGLLNIVALVPFGIIISVVYNQYKYLGVLLVIAPIVLARYTFSLYVQTKSQYVQTVDTLMRAMEARDKYTEGHSQRVAQLATAIAKELKYNEWKVENLNMAALLHDVGKIGIDDNILNKPGKLTNEEFQAIKNHPEIGYNILKDIKSLESILPIVRYHHERYDGKGYPSGKKADELDLDTFIIQLADSIDAMATDRPYRKALTQEQIIDEIEKNAGTQFHPQAVEAYLNMVKKQKKVV